MGRRAAREEQRYRHRQGRHDARHLRRADQSRQRRRRSRPRRAGDNARGAACASDGFFPFADGLEAAVAGGCTAIIAPGGSIRDEEVIAAADRHGAAFVFSTYRYFLH